MISELPEIVMFKDRDSNICIVDVVEFEGLEEIRGSFDYGDEAANAAYLERFEDGDLDSVTLRCKKYDSNLVLIETDYVGGFHVKSAHFKQDVQEAAEFTWK